MARGWLLYSTFLVMSLTIFVQVQGLGVNWGTKTTHSLPPGTVIQMLKDNGINKLKFYDVEPATMTALAGSGIDVTVALPNYLLADMGNYIKAKEWVKENVIAFKPGSKDGVNITMVAIGNEPFLNEYQGAYSNATLPALQNIQKALDEAGLGQIKATVIFTGDVYSSPFGTPVPSAGKFRPDTRDAVVAILKSLDRSKAPLMVNIHPFVSAYKGKGNFPLEYAFFDGIKTPIMDGKVGYNNVYDANLDTLAAALNAEGFGKMPIIVGEVGWPTDGDFFANTTLAARFNNGLMQKLSGGKGTALRPGTTEVYLSSLFDENEKSTLTGSFERHWGIFTYDGQPKYELDLSGGNKKFIVGAKEVKYLANKWCAVKQNVKDKSALDAAITFACDRTDCSALEIGGSCSSLDDYGKASYALNNYFQTMNQAKESCGSRGLADVTDKNLTQGSCNFPIQIVVKEEAALAPESSSPGTASQAEVAPKSSTTGRPLQTEVAPKSSSPGRPLQMAVAFSAVIFASIVLN